MYSGNVTSQEYDWKSSKSAYPYAWPLQICLLGSFRVLQEDQLVPVRGHKTITLLCQLARAYADGLPRGILLDILWPACDAVLAAEALQNRIYSLHKLLGPALGGAAPVVYADGRYRLNTAAGVGTDVVCFDRWVATGDRQARAEHVADAATAYQHAIHLYHGDLDLCIGTDMHALLERERVRVRYLGALSWLAEHAYAKQDYTTSLDYAQRLLDNEPCREDAHRLVMRSYLRRGERAQALRQYRLCEAILRTEFATIPEPATMILFEQVCRDPASI
jgi:DNA-binding SARP family transcriptional activator